MLILNINNSFATEFRMKYLFMINFIYVLWLNNSQMYEVLFNRKLLLTDTQNYWWNALRLLTRFETGKQVWWQHQIEMCVFY